MDANQFQTEALRSDAGYSDEIAERAWSMTQDLLHTVRRGIELGEWAGKLKAKIYYGRALSGSAPGWYVKAAMEEAPSSEMEELVLNVSDLHERGLIWNERNSDVLHGLLGQLSEAGEAMEALLKLLGSEDGQLDETNLMEEAGDSMWYSAKTLDAIDVEMSDAMQRIIDKLHARFPDKFTQDRANNRNLNAERQALES